VRLAEGHKTTAASSGVNVSRCW